MRIPPIVPFLIVIAVLSAAAGLFYAALTQSSSYLASMIYGCCIGLTISSVERGLLLSEAQKRIRSWPTAAYVVVSEAAAVVLVAIGVMIGGLISWTIGLMDKPLLEAVTPTPQVLIYALIVSGALVFVTRVRDLLGHDVFTNLLIGRYHRPVEERRIFLFLDVVGSTTFAKQHGDLRALDYLGAIFAAIAEPVRLHKGAIDDYIGDMALITWPEQRGLDDARCIRCVVAIIEEIERHATDWMRRFGQVPEFHAALHGGAVVTAEVGIDRHKIAYFGDVVNTTARIESLSRDLGAKLLVSADLLGRLKALPPNVRAFSRGDHPIKGHDQRLEVFSLEPGSGASVHALRPRPGATRAV